MKEISNEALDRYDYIWDRWYGSSILFNDWKNAIRKGQDIYAIINGPRRSGKSTLCLTFGEALDPVFQMPAEAMSRFCYSSEEFSKLINSDLPAGSVIIYDDVGTEMSGLKGKQWWDPITMAINDTLQVIGHKNLIVLFTMPDQRLITKDTRTFCTHYIQTFRNGISMHERTNQCIIQQIVEDPKAKTTYYYNLKTPNGHKIKNWTFKFPLNGKLAKAYDELGDMRKGIIERLGHKKILYQKDLNEKQYLTPKFIAEEVISKRDRYITISKKGKFKINTGLISADFSCGLNKVQLAKQLINYHLQQEQGK